MKMPVLTEKQLSAIGCKGNMAVTAGAGTGKTLVLVERYLDILLKQEVDIRQILAITFTKKAAAEMMTRVADRIDGLLADSNTGHKRERLLQIRGHLSAAYISTIHSFCSRILREYPVEAGIDPDFTQLSDMQFELLFNEALNESLNELNSEEENWMDLFRALRIWSVEQMLREALGHRFEMQRVLEIYDNHSPEDLYTQLVASYLKEGKGNTDPAILKQILFQVQEILVIAQNQGLNDPIIEELKELQKADDQNSIEFWRALVNLRSRFTTQKKQAYTNLRFLGGKQLWGEVHSGKVLRLSGLFAELAELPEPVPGPVDLRNFRIMVQFLALYRRVEERFRLKKQLYNMVDYDDLQLLVYHLLNTNDTLRQSVARRFRYIMVDEFQDTNPLQWAIINLLGDLSDKKHFIVGDPKQSIYGFRNADVRVFNRVKQSFISHAPDERHMTDIVLEDSFRFKEHLAGFINRLFGGIMRNETGREWEVGYDPMVCKRRDADGGEVVITLLEGDSQPASIAAHVTSIWRGSEWKPGDIALLLRTRNHLLEIEETLRKEGIPFKTIGGIGFFQRQEIFDVYHLIRFLISPEDDIALIGLLRSPFADISDEGIFMLSLEKEPARYWQKLLRANDDFKLPSDDRRKLKRFRELAENWLYWRDRMSFNELLDSIFNQSGFRAIYAADQKAARYLANLDKILDQAVELERSGFASLADFGEALQNLIRSQIQESEAQVEIEDKTTVKIMTIHQAKGLEFPVVILPYLEQQLRSESYNTAIFDEQYGFAPALADEDRPGYLQETVRKRARQKALAELKRLFYVGCTRAKDKLILLGSTKAGSIPSETPLSWLVDQFEIDPAGHTGPVIDTGVTISYTMPATRVTPGRAAGQITRNIRTLQDHIDRHSMTEQRPYYFLAMEDQPAGEIFSATQLMIYDRSPVEYYERYHLGYFASDYDFSLRLESEEDTAILRGKLIHKYFEEYQDFDLRRTLHEYEITDEGLIRRLRGEVEETIDRITKSEKISAILGAKEYANEVSVICTMREDLLTGMIDRLFRNDNDEWEIIDYKTNRISPSQVDETARTYRLQLDVYALLLAGLFPAQDVYRVNLYFTHIDLLRTFEYRSQDLGLCEKKITEKIRGIKTLNPYRSA